MNASTLLPELDDSPARVLSRRELIPKLAKRGFKGDFIIPLPTPHIVSYDPRTRPTETVSASAILA